MGTNQKEIRYIFNNLGNNSLVYDNYIIPYCRPNKDGSINYKCRHHDQKCRRATRNPPSKPPSRENY